MSYTSNITTGILLNGTTSYFGTRINSEDGRFVIGHRSRYQDNFGLYTTDSKSGLSYRPARAAQPAPGKTTLTEAGAGQTPPQCCLTCCLGAFP